MGGPFGPFTSALESDGGSGVGSEPRFSLCQPVVWANFCFARWNMETTIREKLLQSAQNGCKTQMIKNDNIETYLP